MSEEISVMKRLNSKLRVLKDSRLFISHKELNGRSARNGFCGMGMRSAIEDDYILILNINRKNNIAITINYKKLVYNDNQQKAFPQVSIVASKGDTVDVDYKLKRTENVHRSKSYSFDEFSKKLRQFNKVLETLTSDNVSDVFSEIMDIKDPARMDAEEKQEKTKEIVEVLAPLYKKSNNQKSNIKNLEDKIFVTRSAANKEIQELPESVKLAEMMKKVAILQGIVDRKRKEAFAPVVELEKECATAREKVNDTQVEIERHEVVFRKQLTKKDFNELIKSIK